MEHLLTCNPHDTFFWDAVPSLKVLEPFKDLFKKDRSKDKHRSSKIMWAMFLTSSPKSPWYNLDNKLDAAAKNIILDDSFDWKEFDEHLHKMQECMLSEAEKSLVMWDEFMYKRRQFISQQEYTLENAVDLDKIAANSIKLYQDLEKIKKSLRDESMSAKDSNNVYED